MKAKCTHVMASMFPVTVTKEGDWLACGRSEMSAKVMGDLLDAYLVFLRCIEKVTFGLCKPRVSLVPVDDSFMNRFGGRDIG